MGFKDKRDLHRYQRTSLANSGRAAGMGVSYDRGEMKTFRCQTCGVYCYSAADQKTCARCYGKLKEEPMSNKKAPDVNHDAVENNQLQDITKVKENQIPDGILAELATMQKRFRELCGEYRLCGIGDSAGVHLNDEAFIATFKDYETSAFSYKDYSEELTATMHGIKFFCIR